jgi:hypothetical protein
MYNETIKFIDIMNTNNNFKLKLRILKYNTASFYVETFVSGKRQRMTTNLILEEPPLKPLKCDIIKKALAFRDNLAYGFTYNGITKIPEKTTPQFIDLDSTFENWLVGYYHNVGTQRSVRLAFNNSNDI